MNIVVELAGPPVAKARPRFGRGHAYTAPATRNHERTVAWAAKIAMAGRPPITGAVTLAAVFELPIPASWSKTRRSAAITGSIKPTNKPDTDNLVKALLDGINGIIFVDDAQVVEFTAMKAYGITPKTILTVTPLHAAPSNERAS